jgi:hypothetical protein
MGKTPDGAPSSSSPLEYQSGFGETRGGARRRRRRRRCIVKALGPSQHQAHNNQSSRGVGVVGGG